MRRDNRVEVALTLGTEGDVDVNDPSWRGNVNLDVDDPSVWSNLNVDAHTHMDDGVG